MSEPYIELRLKPVWGEARISLVSIHVRMMAADGGGTAGRRLFSLNRRTAGKAFATLEGEISIGDAAGELPCSVDREQLLHIEREHYQPLRNPSGPVDIRYTVIPAAAGENPSFDLGCEPDGINGSGLTFLPLCETGRCRITVAWDFSEVPEGFRGIWSFGEGRVELFDEPSLIQETFYYAGRIRSVESGNFGFYWLDYPDLDLTRTAETARGLFLAMSAFFGDRGEPYRIFARRGPCSKLGGTALKRSYQFIYAPPNMPEPERVKFLFAHEMVHNWASMQDEPFGTTTWYGEGTAEYYSALLPWKLGLVSDEELVVELNRRSALYCENPFIGVHNRELGRKLFIDMDATRVPYGRGFFYLLAADARIRSLSGGIRTVDDVVLPLVQRCREGSLPGNDDWLALLVPLIGEAAEADFRAMERGAEIEPSAECFAGRIWLRKRTGTVRAAGGLPGLNGRREAGDPAEPDPEAGELREAGEPCIRWEFYSLPQS